MKFAYTKFTILFILIFSLHTNIKSTSDTHAKNAQAKDIQTTLHDLKQKKKELLLKKIETATDESLQARFDLATLYTEEQSYNLALEQFEFLVGQKPDNTNYAFQRANVLNTINKTEDALQEYNRLLIKHPDNPIINYNIAYTNKKLGKIDKALPYYYATIQKDPNHAEAHFGLGLAYLATEDFIRGFEEYEWRWKRTSQKSTAREYPQPEWDGSSLANKTIFLYAEQGLGDTYQFIRYAQELKKMGASVIVAVQNPLVQVIGLCPYIDKVIGLSEQPPQFDYYAPLMSLPRICKTTSKTVPNTTPYLYADKKLTETWKKKLAADTNIKVGVCWQGNDQYSTAFLRTVVAAKCILLKQLAPLAAIPNVSLYNLQKETGTDQLNDDYGFKLISFDADFDATNGRFMDTAAVIANLDLIITVDTSIAHLAAGLGRPTWVPLPEPADWRWMLKRVDSPWYPTMRLFRQPTQGDWDSVLATITKELKTFVLEKKMLQK